MSVTQDVDREFLQRQPWHQSAWALLRKQPLAAFGGLLVLTFAVMAAFAEYIAPHNPEIIDFENMLTAPGGEYLLGTDQFGRDLLSRLIYGARTALFIGCIAAGTGATTGLVIGVASAYFGGKVDLIVQRIIDVFIAFPTIIIALSIVAVFGSDLRHVIFAICLPFIPDAARIVRSNALAIREIPYVDAARVMRIVLHPVRIAGFHVAAAAGGDARWMHGWMHDRLAEFGTQAVLDGDSMVVEIPT